MQQNAIIVDNGTRLMRAGIIANVDCALDNDVPATPPSVIANWSNLNMVKNCEFVDVSKLESFYEQHVFSNPALLNANSNNTLFINEPYCTSYKDREQFITMLFEKFSNNNNNDNSTLGFSSLYSNIRGACAATSSQNFDGHLLIQSMEHETVLVPVWSQCRVLRSFIKRIDKGSTGSQITANLQSLINTKYQGNVPPLSIDFDTAEKIKQKYTYATIVSDHTALLKKINTPDAFTLKYEKHIIDRPFELKTADNTATTTTINVAAECFQCIGAEFFKPITEAFESILDLARTYGPQYYPHMFPSNSSFELKKQLSFHMLLRGGNSHIRNMGDRLKVEMGDITTTCHSRVQVESNDKQQQVHQSWRDLAEFAKFVMMMRKQKLQNSAQWLSTKTLFTKAQFDELGASAVHKLF